MMVAGRASAQLVSLVYPRSCSQTAGRACWQSRKISPVDDYDTHDVGFVQHSEGFRPEQPPFVFTAIVSDSGDSVRGENSVQWRVSCLKSHIWYIKGWEPHILAPIPGLES